MSICLCVSSFRKSTFLCTHSGVDTRNVWHRLGQEYMYVRLSISYFANLYLQVHAPASLQEMYSVGWGKSICLCVCVFLAFIILHLYMHTVASLQKNISHMLARSICVCLCLFPALLILHLQVDTLASLEEMYSVGWGNSIRLVAVCFLLC